MSLFKSALTNPLPPVLWHGSAYLSAVLKPGFLWNHKLVEWDNGESNHYLYATTEREQAISLGFASAIEHKWKLDNYHSEGEEIAISSPKRLTHFDLEQLVVWLYEIHPHPDEQWVYNHNQANSLNTEYKTHRIVQFARREQVDLAKWLGQRNVTIKKT